MCGASVQGDIEDADFLLARQSHGAAERLGEKLMAKANSKEGPDAHFHPFANCRFFRNEPGVLILLPNVHGTAQHIHEVVTGKRGQGFAAMDHDPVDGKIIGAQKIAEAAGAVFIHMLKQQNAPCHLVSSSMAFTGGSTSVSA